MEISTLHRLSFAALVLTVSQVLACADSNPIGGTTGAGGAPFVVLYRPGRRGPPAPEV